MTSLNMKGGKQQFIYQLQDCISWLTRQAQQTFCKGSQFSLPNLEKKMMKSTVFFNNVKLKQLQTARKDSLSVCFESEHWVLSHFLQITFLHSYYRETQPKISDSNNCKLKPEIWSKFCKRSFCHSGRVLIWNSDTAQPSDICHNYSGGRN